ncbi:MAG TPA: leucyl aminopeptidase family protein [Alphaproteobacteria bacterium]
MSSYLIDRDDGRAVPVTPVAERQLASWLERQPAALRAWLDSTRFRAEPGEVSLVAGPDGGLGRVVLGVGDDDPFAYGALPDRLPEGSYRLAPEGAAAEPPGWQSRAALGWALGTYAFTRYKARKKGFASLIWPEGADRAAVERLAEAVFLVRDLINTPANDMGPAELAAAARDLGRRHGARVSVIAGDDLLAANYPSIHAVGAASSRPPCLIDLVWGEADAPRLTLVGKGVCFDSGGLDIKPAESMKMMKKDMGGAAHVLGLASVVMAAGLPVRLRVLIPAVENAVGGRAMRPLDVIKTRKGLTVEIGHTDAEGRVVLSDALAEAASETPALLIDYATLTGAARVALGADLPALFSNDDALAADLMRHGTAEGDPMWRLPLWRGYRRMIDGKTADLTNSAEGSHAGAITAALFLQEFVGEGVPWAHIDLLAWNLKSRPGRPEGGEAQTLRAVYALIAERFGK